MQWGGFQWHNFYSDLLNMVYWFTDCKERYSDTYQKSVLSHQATSIHQKVRGGQRRPSNAQRCEQTRGSGDDPETLFKKMHHDTTAREEIHLRRK